MLSQKQALEKMEVDIRLRGLSSSTLDRYLAHTATFLHYCKRPVEELNELHVRKFLEYLIKEKNLQPATVNVYSAAIRFFFAVTLNRTMNYLQIPRMKKTKALPVILTKAEISMLLVQSNNRKHKALLLLAYGSGLRISEIARLKVEDIDSKSMRVFVRESKGKKDRYSLLSESTLDALRDYWRQYRPKNSEGWLFPGTNNTGHITKEGIRYALNTALKKTSITKNITVHTLRHCFATHLLEDGFNLLQIKELLGHSSISSTLVYLHLANTTKGIKSPADQLTENIFENKIL